MNSEPVSYQFNVFKIYYIPNYFVHPLVCVLLQEKEKLKNNNEITFDIKYDSDKRIYYFLL